MRIRRATAADIPAMARIREAEWETIEYWQARIAGYLDGTQDPRSALATREAFVVTVEDEVVGFVAGHLTNRHGCTGELEWLNVARAHRERGVGSTLLRAIAGWFVQTSATNVCVDVDPANLSARRLYESHGARELNAHWLVWDDIGGMLRSG
jgi:ribosomal protein S18 acetylase RimI-like enzyme